MEYYLGRIPHRHPLTGEREVPGTLVNSEARDVVAIRMQDIHEVAAWLDREVTGIIALSPDVSRIQQPAIRIDIECDETVVKPVEAIKKLPVLRNVNLRGIVSSRKASRQRGCGLPFVRQPAGIRIVVIHHDGRTLFGDVVEKSAVRMKIEVAWPRPR